MDLLTRLIINKLKNEKGSVTPTGTINITENGETDVTNYATANVNVACENNAKVSGANIAGIEATIKNIIVEVNSLVLSNSVTQTANLFNGCFNMTKAPTMDTKNIISMNYMFYNCSSLTDIPVYDTSKVSALNSVFSGCTALTNTSLNNILEMCANASLYTGTKTLKYIGLTSDQATACTGLSNWAAAQTAGWTTGY